MPPPMGLASREWSGVPGVWVGTVSGSPTSGADIVWNRGGKYGQGVIILLSADPISSHPWDRGGGYLDPWGGAAGGRSGW